MNTLKINARRIAAGLALAGIVLMLGACAHELKASGNDQAGRIHTVAPAQGQDVAYFAGGCFWAMQAMMGQLKGVVQAVPGYAGGNTPNPTYDQVCTHTTGYAEAVRVVFDPKVISYRQLLRVFFSVHDPTTLNRQGDDEGTNYRSAIFYHNDEQKGAAQEAITDANRSLGGNVVVTQVVPFSNFYAAEEYHNNYFANHPDAGYCQIVVAPKVEKFRNHWHALLKQ